MAKARTKSLYSLHPGYAMEASSMAKLKERTGKTLEDWIALIQKSGPPGEKERRDWLKNQHGMSTNYAWWLVYRRHVFAQMKPRTRTETDLGFALRDRPVEGRLEDTGGFAKKDRITHRILIRSVADIDDEVEKWLRIAYDSDR